MGGKYYDRLLGTTTNPKGFSFGASSVFKLVTSMNFNNEPSRFSSQKLKCKHKNPIIFALDVTGSMGNWSKVPIFLIKYLIILFKIIYDKLPMFYGQIMMQGYLPDPSVSFCAIGDATCDDAPLQVTEFGQGSGIDQLISKIYLEGNGGSGSYESYELAGYFYLNCCEIKNAELPFLFITGDEHYYATLEAKTIRNVLGRKDEKIHSINIWKKLKTKFNIFFLHKEYEFNPKENEHIIRQWVQALGKERVIEIYTPKACIDIILGIIALTSGTRTLDEYCEDLVEREQSEERVKEVRMALIGLHEDFIDNEIIGGLFYQNTKFNKNIEGKNNENTDEQKEFEEIKQETTETKNIQRNLKCNHKKRSFNEKVPNEFYCPITMDILKTPVILEDGFTYEEDAIKVWLQIKQTSPITGLFLSSSKLFPNTTLKKMIDDWKEKKLLFGDFGQFK